MMTNKVIINEFYIIKVIFLYLSLFLLFYSEPLLIFGIKIAVIWKVLLLCIMLPVVINYLIEHKKVELFIILALLLSLKMSINLSSSLEYFNTTASIVVKNMMFPVMFLYLSLKMNKYQLIFLVKHFAIFTIISFIPFMLHLVQPFSQGYNLSTFGGKNIFGLTGVFMGAHPASESIAFMLIVLYYFYQNAKKIFFKYLYIGLLLLGVYEIILTYARSGLVIAAIGIFYLWLKEKGKKKFYTLFLLVIPIIIGSVYIYQTNKVFKMRIEDKTIYKQQELGSGRFEIASNALSNWSSDGITAIIIGLGYDYGVEKMKKSIHNEIFAHNNFVQVLQQEGIIGFVLFILFLYYLYKYIQFYKTSKYYNVSMALFLGLIIEMLLQGNFLFHMYLALVIFLILLKKNTSLLNTN